MAKLNFSLLLAVAFHFNLIVGALAIPNPSSSNNHAFGLPKLNGFRKSIISRLSGRGGEKKKFDYSKWKTVKLASWGLDKCFERAFKDGDIDGDNRLNFSEAYELILLIWCDRQPPIPPPSREAVSLLFKEADLDKTGKLKMTEFKLMVRGLLERSSFRLIAHKIVSYIVAPLLAWESVRILAGRSLLGDRDIFVSWYWKEWLAKWFPFLPASLVDSLTTEEFWKATLTVLFVNSLGDIVMGIAGSTYDKLFIKAPAKSDD